MSKTLFKRTSRASKAKTSALSLLTYVNGESGHPSASNETIPKIASLKKIRLENLKKISPLTENQNRMFEQYEAGNSLMCHGSAGVGKTFLACYLGLREILSRETDFEKLVIVRSVTPVKDIGFLPGTAEEKIDVYQQPYRAIFAELFPRIDSPTEKLTEQGLYEFIPTSFIRGVTLHKSIIIMDEFSSANYHESDSVITRLGEDCKIIFCGDVTQTDLQKRDDVLGVNKFMNILKHVPEFRTVEFTAEDIVRSTLVKNYILAKQRIEEELYENQRGRN